MNAMEKLAKEVVQNIYTAIALEQFPLDSVILSALNQAVQRERERCASVCDLRGQAYLNEQDESVFSSAALQAMFNATVECAEDIRKHGI